MEKNISVPIKAESLTGYLTYNPAMFDIIPVNKVLGGSLADVSKEPQLLKPSISRQPTDTETVTDYGNENEKLICSFPSLYPSEKYSSVNTIKTSSIINHSKNVHNKSNSAIEIFNNNSEHFKNLEILKKALVNCNKSSTNGQLKEVDMINSIQGSAVRPSCSLSNNSNDNTNYSPVDIINSQIDDHINKLCDFAKTSFGNNFQNKVQCKKLQNSKLKTQISSVNSLIKYSNSRRYNTGSLASILTNFPRLLNGEQSTRFVQNHYEKLVKCQQQNIMITRSDTIDNSNSDGNDGFISAFQSVFNRAEDTSTNITGTSDTTSLSYKDLHSSSDLNEGNNTSNSTDNFETVFLNCESNDVFYPENIMCLDDKRVRTNRLKRIARCLESPEKRAQRLLQVREHARFRRSNETPEQRDDRLRKDREKKRKYRAKLKQDVSYEEILEKNRMIMRRRRMDEMYREKERERDRIRHQIKRANVEFRIKEKEKERERKRMSRFLKKLSEVQQNEL